MKIALVKLSALGDIVHTSIVLQFIKKNIPFAKISWFVDEKFAPILQNNDDIEEIVKLPLKNKEFSKSYKTLLKYKNGFDIIIDMQGLIKSAIVCKILGKNRVGFDSNSIKEPLASLFYTKKLNCSYNENIIVRNLNLVSWALGFNYTKEEILNKKSCFKTYCYEFKILSSYSKNILIAPFSSDASKNYGRMKEIINAFGNENVFICHGNENEYKNALLLAKNTNAKVLEKMSISEMISLISKCDLLIGNDSGITHIAWAQNRPSITLFGNRPSKRNTYKTDINIPIDAGKKVDARNIDKNDLCINEIEPARIITVAKEILYGT